eukprot:CAMPEP_0178922678 /NCGR_PEP_ID=MMETSP0786-20121207/16293_1 /TAXON_ID=186022 /ORGANISM="Thalassionema frauenfeldii, Strain CCMP 1798" /LENGTH=410 /DNA_ID=CAMNT_0020597081 /DNA_START=314 /DNA_END=1546 /DNA_ORIENTATION=+
MSIDIPEMRDAFDGDCQLDFSKIYPDEIAPAKKIGNENTAMRKIMQKSFVKSFVRCKNKKKIGVELLEASVSNLNPKNMRKTYQVGNLMKYNVDEGRDIPASIEEKANKSNNEDEETSQEKKERGPNALTNEEEIDAPWNQYAWIEELQLRVQGKVPFGSTLNPSSLLTRVMFGNVYKVQVPSNRAFWEWLLPPVWHRDPAGIEGADLNNWASQKPHAVIADGAAMQLIPGSLRFLQKTCQEAEVPLFIVNDPRVWGGNTHQDLREALQDMRKTIKYKIVKDSIRGTGFEWGRLLGRAETEAKWQAKDMGRRTREAVQGANRRLKREKAYNWSDLSADQLRKKLVEHKVIKDSSDNGKAPIYSNAMIQIAQYCVSAGLMEKENTSDVKIESEATQSEQLEKKQAPDVVAA